MNKFAIQIIDLSFEYYIKNDNSSIRKKLFSIFQKTKNKENNNKVVFKDINLNISKGDAVGLYSSNGSGKTTLLKLIYGVYKPTNGQIKINGKCNSIIDIFAGSENEANGIENIYIRSLLNGKSKSNIKKNIKKIIDFSELKDSINNPFKTYSSGMKLRLVFSTSILSDADIYLIDEWISVGDAKFQKKCLKKINELKKKNKTVIITSQNIDFLRKFCDYVYTINNTKLLLKK